MTKEQFREAVTYRWPKETVLIEEYIEEVENQEGDDYWKQFTSIGLALEDFQIFINVCKEADSD